MSAYETLLQQAYEDIEHADFDALRQAYTQRPDYRPYERSGIMLELRPLIEAQEWQAAVTMGEQELLKDALFIELHTLLAFLQHQLGRTPQEQWHLRFVQGLLHSVFNSGNGISPATAFRVVHFRETYDVLRALKCRFRGQALIHEDGKAFDRMDVTLPDGREMALFFDISQIFGRL
jgi:hypothetical protein